jgi:signal transduction histidine kinase
MDQAKDEFIGMVSHEMRTPLTVVAAAIQTLADSGVSEQEAKELLEEANLGARTLAAILDNLLELARYQAGRLELDRRAAGLPAVIEATARRVQKRYPDANIAFELPDDLHQARIDVSRLEQVAYNLLENAVKYSPEGSQVKVFTRKQDSKELLVMVADKGPGIAPEDQSKLFNSFTRLVTGKPGLGLGLTVCKRLVEAHGGRIWVESKPGEGSTFYFTIPLK